jgi:tRNA threonylcarbamoyl adenosine modification protein YeaZ
MLILAFDTTGEYGGAGIFHDSQCLASVANSKPESALPGGAGSSNYSVVLFQMVDHLLAQTGLQFRDIELFAVANGPGSFTGIRVGVAAAQGWARAFSRPVCGVSVLEAMVEAARPETDWAIPLMDARRGEFFAAAVQRRGGEQVSTFPSLDGWEQGLILKPDALSQFVWEVSRAGTVSCAVREYDARARALRPLLAGDAPVQVVANANAREAPSHHPGTFSRTLDNAHQQGIPAAGPHWLVVEGTLVAAVAAVALRACREGKAQSPAEVDALYIRRSDAEMHWREE